MSHESPPVLVVHGIWDSARRMAPLVEGLRARGVVHVRSFDLLPANGSAGIARLGALVVREAQALAAEHAVAKIDLVGFSMGALLGRWFLQRGGGKQQVRRFVSIAGPHAGTWSAYALPLAGPRDMRPNSVFLRDLAADPDPWGEVEVHCLYTPYDAMILPATSSILPGARSVQAIPVKMHRFLVTDARVHDRVAATLLAQHEAPARSEDAH